MSSDRNSEMEVKVAYLEQGLNTLSDEFFAQKKELDTLKSQLASLIEKLGNPQNGESADQPVVDEKPPHY